MYYGIWYMVNDKKENMVVGYYSTLLVLVLHIERDPIWTYFYSIEYRFTVLSLGTIILALKTNTFYIQYIFGLCIYERFIFWFWESPTTGWYPCKVKKKKKTLSFSYNMHLFLPYLLNDSQTICSIINFSKPLLCMTLICCDWSDLI